MDDDQTEDLKNWLQSQDGIQECIRVGKAIRFEMPDEDEAKAELLSRAIENGFRITSFAPKQRSLEEAFLHVTQGRVQ